MFKFIFGIFEFFIIMFFVLVMLAVGLNSCEKESKPKNSITKDLMSMGLTKKEAKASKKILKKCGIKSISGYEPTDPDASIDNLICYRVVLDRNEILIITFEKRKIYYIGYNGDDLYANGKVIKKVKMVRYRKKTSFQAMTLFYFRR